MDTLAALKIAIFDGKLKPEDADLGRYIIERYGEETFHHFLLYRAIDAQQPSASPQLLMTSSPIPDRNH